ncbi:MAG: YjbH domain-containing protein [Chlamydiia bacterium]|nr:YjbH domain-containing protein [Chlamydiia bacterium]
MILWIFLFLVGRIFAEECPYHGGNLVDDLMIVDWVDRRVNDPFPVQYNLLFQGGYINMPSARMECEGRIGIGYSSIPPYRLYNLRCQVTNFLEVSGNYRVFKGIPDPILSDFGFGNKADKGVNVKLSLLKPEDSLYKLPGIAIGAEDFLGTQTFKSKYVVVTHVLPDYNFEASVGLGAKRIKGWFGGALWMPWRHSCYRWLQPIALVAEYDATDTKHDPHPDGRKTQTPINFGLNYRFNDIFQFSANYIRGKAFAGSLSATYNFGYCEGFLPKIDNPPLHYPCCDDPIEKAFRKQKFSVHLIERGYKDLRITLQNKTYRTEDELLSRLRCLLAACIPCNISQVTIVLETDGFPIQEYHFPMEYVRQWSEGEICETELSVLVRRKEVCFPLHGTRTTLFSCPYEPFCFKLVPHTYTLFGSARGKFKYSLGVGAAVSGFLPTNIYYSAQVGYPLFTDLENVSDVDRLNPSQIINVRTDLIRYIKQRGVQLDEAYLQKGWNLGYGVFARLSGGYFERQYGGVASELLWYPLKYPFSFGAEAAILWKRDYSGLRFQHKIRKLNGFTPSYLSFTGSQYFFNFYYDWRAVDLDLKVKLGKFLAADWGARFEVSRYFPSGLILTLWYTYTNGKDMINGQTYYDKGVSLSMPLDIFYTYSCRKRFGFGMSAWLRDVGAISATGRPLYSLIREHR